MWVEDQPTVRKKLFQQGLSWQEQPEFSQTSIQGAQLNSIWVHKVNKLMMK